MAKVCKIVSIDKYGRLVIPKKIRDRVSTNTFIIELTEDGKILLDMAEMRKIVNMDKSGRLVIPKNIREKVTTDTFVIELTEDGKILLDPLHLNR